MCTQKVSLLWSCLLVGFGVGLQRCSWTGLGEGGDSSKRRGGGEWLWGLPQPSSLICPITIKHTSWHLNSPPCLACSGLSSLSFPSLSFWKAVTFSLLNLHKTLGRRFKTRAPVSRSHVRSQISFENWAPAAAAVRFFSTPSFWDICSSCCPSFETLRWNASHCPKMTTSQSGRSVFKPDRSLPYSLALWKSSSTSAARVTVGVALTTILCKSFAAVHIKYHAHMLVGIHACGWPI